MFRLRQPTRIDIYFKNIIFPVKVSDWEVRRLKDDNCQNKDAHPTEKL